jgi:Fe-S cluster assembly ATPase SufC
MNRSVDKIYRIVNAAFYVNNLEIVETITDMIENVDIDVADRGGIHLIHTPLGAGKTALSY